ncbi:MAG: recombinase zinc beta ribbon domain-containing protein, partial [Armatimonadota bacterium]
YRGETVHKDDCYPGEHEAIISQNQWDAVQSMISANPRKAQRTHESVPALLGGIIRCGHCDRAMTSTYTRKGGRTYRYYVCTKASKSGYDSCPVKTVAAGDMERAVIGQLRAIFRSPEMIAQTYLAVKRLEADEASDTTITQWDVIDALKKFDQAWEALNPAEQRRVVGCLVESVTVSSNGLDVQFRTDGMHSLITSINDNERVD